MDSSVWANLTSGGLGSLTGAFIGSWLSFWLQKKYNQRQQQEREIIGVKMYLLAIFERINTLLNIYDQHIKDYIKEKRQPGHMLPILCVDNNTYLNIYDVQFLLRKCVNE